jgi:hypothetical protein
MLRSESKRNGSAAIEHKSNPMGAYKVNTANAWRPHRPLASLLPRNFTPVEAFSRARALSRFGVTFEGGFSYLFHTHEHVSLKSKTKKQKKKPISQIESMTYRLLYLVGDTWIEHVTPAV